MFSNMAKYFPKKAKSGTKTEFKQHCPLQVLFRKTYR